MNDEATPPPEPVQGAPAAASVPLVTGLSPAIVSLREFPIRKWYYSDPLWYYHAPSKFHQLKVDGKFYEHVDPLLRELCEVLLQAGLCTTPSCQGHDYPHSHFERVWNLLTVEATAIRNEGLIVRDCEDERALRFHDPAYALCWSSAEEFFQQAEPLQVNGYLGFVVPAEREALIGRLCDEAFSGPGLTLRLDPELTAIIGASLFAIEVRPDSEQAREAAWSEVTDYLRSVLKVPPTGPASSAAG